MGKFAKVLLQILGVLALVGLALRLLLFEAWTVPQTDAWLGAAVAPTLAGGDTVLLLTVGTPGFGDLVRCKDPEAPTRWIVGRIVGEEGNIVEVPDGFLVVDGKRFTTNEACKESQFTFIHPDTGSQMEGTCGRVEMAGGWHFMGTAGGARKADDKKHTVGPGRFFILSDNRFVHDDSRDFGAIPVEYCQERVVFRLWSGGGWGDSKHRMDVIR